MPECSGFRHNLNKAILLVVEIIRYAKNNVTKQSMKTRRIDIHIYGANLVPGSYFVSQKLPSNS